MKQLKRLIQVFGLSLLMPILAHAGASGHAGHTPGGGSGSGGKGCPKVIISDMDPAPLTEMPAGSSFSVAVVGAKNADDIEVTVKKIEVPVSAVRKGDFFEVSGKLPAELHGVAARVNVKVKGKVAACDYENGWLYKIQ